MGVAKGVRGHPRLSDLGAITCASKKSRQRRIRQRFLTANFTGLIWTVFFVSFVIVFALQWGGIHLRALLSGSSSGYMIDWNNVALVRPDVISINSAVFLSAGIIPSA